MTVTVNKMHTSDVHMIGEMCNGQSIKRQKCIIICMKSHLRRASAMNVTYPFANKIYNVKLNHSIRNHFPPFSRGKSFKHVLQ